MLFRGLYLHTRKKIFTYYSYYFCYNILCFKTLLVVGKAFFTYYLPTTVPPTLLLFRVFSLKKALYSNQYHAKLGAELGADVVFLQKMKDFLCATLVFLYLYGVSHREIRLHSGKIQIIFGFSIRLH